LILGIFAALICQIAATATYSFRSVFAGFVGIDR